MGALRAGGANSRPGRHPRSASTKQWGEAGRRRERQHSTAPHLVTLGGDGGAAAGRLVPPLVAEGLQHPSAVVPLQAVMGCYCSAWTAGVQRPPAIPSLLGRGLCWPWIRSFFQSPGLFVPHLPMPLPSSLFCPAPYLSTASKVLFFFVHLLPNACQVSNENAQSTQSGKRTWEEWEKVFAKV